MPNPGLCFTRPILSKKHLFIIISHKWNNASGFILQQTKSPTATQREIFAYDDSGGVFVDPCSINAMIAAITNHLFTTLSKKDFAALSVFLNELSKSMFATAVFRDICERYQKQDKDDC